MESKELLHKRVLVVVKSDRLYETKTVEEIKIIEISPSGDWMKIQNMNGGKYWRLTSEITPVEILDDIKSFKG